MLFIHTGQNESGQSHTETCSILKGEELLGFFIVNIRSKEDIEMLLVMWGDCFFPLHVDFSTV